MNAQPEPTDRAEVRKLADAVEEALTQGMPTSYRDATPLPYVGAAPPVPQPGRPPMSQKATDASALMLSGGIASVLVGGAASLVMVTSGTADPVVCAIVFGAPAGLTLAVSQLVRRAKEVVTAAPPDIHHHYNGPVRQHYDQREIHSRTSGLWVKSDNEQQ